MDNQDIITLISIVLAIAGIFISIFFGIEARKQRIKNIKFDWEDVHMGAKKLARRIFKSFEPDIVFASSGPSALIANLMLTETEKYLPIYVGFSQKIDKKDFELTPSYQVEMITTKWKTFLPTDIFQFKDKKILIVEDCVITGDTLHELLKLFEKNGFKRQNILVAALVVTDFAKKAGKNPDEFFYEVSNSSEFYLPWGKGTGKDF